MQAEFTENKNSAVVVLKLVQKNEPILKIRNPAWTSFPVSYQVCGTVLQKVQPFHYCKRYPTQIPCDFPKRWYAVLAWTVRFMRTPDFELSASEIMYLFVSVGAQVEMRKYHRGKL